VKLTEDKKNHIEKYLSVKVEDRKGCQRYTARMIKNVKIGPSPKWLKERLENCGLNSINNVVDVTNYVMLETGQPLHAFDYEKLTGANAGVKKILIRRAKKGEKIVTLDNKIFGLDNDILVIADCKNPLAIAGIKGGKKAEIDEGTKDIILESANFDMSSIRRARQKLGIITDASLRFEHHPDVNLTISAINRASQLIQEIAGGKVVSGVLDFYPKKVLPKKIKIDIEKINKLLGIKINLKETKEIFRRLGFEIIESKAKQLLVGIPSRRLDISIPEDLIEEVGRIYGYEKISPISPVAALIPPKKNLNIFWEDFIKDVLKEVGFSEVYNYSFINEEDVSLFEFSKKDLIELENPVSADQKYLRPTLLPNLIKDIKKNIENFSEIRIFELGKIFKNILTRKPELLEKKKLGGVILASDNDFYEAKGVLDTLFNKLGITNIWYDEFQPKPENFPKIWELSHSAEIKTEKEKIGFLGEINTNVLKEFGISRRAVAFELDFETLQRLASEEQEYEVLSPYPSAVRDIAVLVPSETKVVEVLNKINEIGGKLVRDIDLFDIYQGSEIPRGLKNFAFHIIYQAQDRTLTSEEINRIHQKIIKSLEKNPNWEVRK